MKISSGYNQYTIKDLNLTQKKACNIKEYSNYLMGKYGCLTSGKNAAVTITGGLLRKAMTDEKTGSWLERELSKAPDYIKAAQKSAIAHGTTLKSVSIEFGEEYTTMTTFVISDGGGTDSDIDKWLKRINEKKEEKKEIEKKKEKKEIEADQKTHSIEIRGENLEDLVYQFDKVLSLQKINISNENFDVKA